MLDCHAHLLSQEIYPEELFYKRVEIPHELVDKVLGVLDQHDALDIVSLFAKFADLNKLERATLVIKAFKLSIEKQGHLFAEKMKQAGISQACILGLDLPHWDDMKEAKEDPILKLQDSAFQKLKGEHPELLFFVPFDPRREGAAEYVFNALNSNTYSGVKMYPALGFDVSLFEQDSLVGRQLQEVFSAAEYFNKPIVAHCSGGGLRGPENHSQDSKYFSDPARWFEVLTTFPNLKVCLAHGGGENSFRSIETAEMGWPKSLNTALMDFPNLFVDCAFHNGSVEDSTNYFDIVRKLLSSQFAGQILFGSDWPLHWFSYSYSHLISSWKKSLLEDNVAILDSNAQVFLNQKIL